MMAIHSSHVESKWRARAHVVAGSALTVIWTPWRYQDVIPSERGTMLIPKIPRSLGMTPLLG